MGYTTVIFDYDGTLVDSQEGIAKGFQQALAAYGIREEVEEIKKLIGPPLSRTIVTKYGFDIWIHGKSGMVDAKSLLGMFLLSLNEPLQIVLEDSVDPTALFKDLADYLEIDDEDVDEKK